MNGYSCQSRVEAASGQRSKSLTSHFCLHQKMFADFTAEGIPVIETSTLTEEGVMQVKSEVRQRSVCRGAAQCGGAHHAVFGRPVIASSPAASRQR